jgi:hypothetical protein
LAIGPDKKNYALSCGNRDNDIRHRFTFAPSYAIPGIKVPGQMLEGWTASGILTMQTGTPWSAWDPTSNDWLGTGENADQADSLAGVQQFWNYIGPRSAFTAGPQAVPCFGSLPGCTKNSLNGLQLGHGVAADQIQIACALNGPANVLNYSDYIWQKYRVGGWAKVTDPATGKPPQRNIFYASKVASGAARGAGGSARYSSDDPNSDDSLYQDTSIQALQSRGVRFVSCHTSTEEEARAFIQQDGLSVQPEEVANDMVEHALPGVIIVPSLAAALAILQCQGHYSYMAPDPYRVALRQIVAALQPEGADASKLAACMSLYV